MKHEAKVILISGKQGSGKSTLVKNLREHYPNVVSMRFAEIIYQMHDACLPILKKYKIRKNSMDKDGELLQVLGTEFGRNRVSPDVWVDAAKEYINQYADFYDGLHPSPRTFIIEYTRFRNEIDGFPKAFKIRLEASEVSRKARCSYWRDSSYHPSEIDLDAYVEAGKFDLVLNTDTLTSYQTLHSVIETLIQKGFFK